MARNPFPNQDLGFRYGTRADSRKAKGNRAKSFSRHSLQRGRSMARFETQFPHLQKGNGSNQHNPETTACTLNPLLKPGVARAEKELGFYEPNRRAEDENTFIILPTGVVERDAKKWEQCFVAYVVGNRPHYPALKRSLESQWRIRGGGQAEQEIFGYQAA